MQAVQVGPFKLDAAKVAEARVRFEAKAHHRSKDKTAFDEYLELFASDCTSFTSIGENRPKWRRLTREMVRRVYKKYFADLFPHRPSGRAREKFCTLKRVEIKSRELPMGGVIKEVAEAAVKNGLTFGKEQVKNQRLPFVFKKEVLWLNHKRCLVKSVTRKWQTLGSKRFYTPVHCDLGLLKHYSTLVIIQKVPSFLERFFIIPTADLLEMWGDKKTSSSFYIPLEKLPVYQNIRPRVDWWQYENAWHLLKNKYPTS